MKLVVVGYSQDVDLGAEEAMSFIRLRDEETGAELRAPVPIETIQEIARFIQEHSSQQEAPEESEPPSGTEEGEEPETDVVQQKSPAPSPPPKTAPKKAGPKNEREIPQL